MLHTDFCSFRGKAQTAGTVWRKIVVVFCCFFFRPGLIPFTMIISFKLQFSCCAFEVIFVYWNINLLTSHAAWSQVCVTEADKTQGWRWKTKNTIHIAGDNRIKPRNGNGKQIQEEENKYDHEPRLCLPHHQQRGNAKLLECKQISVTPGWKPRPTLVTEGSATVVPLASPGMNVGWLARSSPSAGGWNPRPS